MCTGMRMCVHENTGDTRSFIWTDHADQDTGTILAIPAQHPGLTCSRKRTLFASTVLAAVITVTAKYLSFFGGQGHAYAFSLVPAWPRPLALAQEAIWARTTPPLFEFSVYRARARGREGINRRQSSNTWKQQQLDYIFF